MSADTPLTLSSQQQLLERLLHLSRLDTDFVLLTGPKGAGKTTLAGLLARHSELHEPVVLDARLLTSNAAFREALLEQWFAGAVFDADDSLLDSMSRLLPAAPGKRLLVIDNAQWLADPLLQELAELCLGLAPEQRPFMVLMGLPSWAGGVCGLLRPHAGLPVLELEVPELSEEDKLQLCRHRQLEPTEALLARMHYPEDLTERTEASMRQPGYRQWLEQKPVKILLTGLILLGLLTLIVALLSEPEPPARVAQPFQAESVPALPETPVTLAAEPPATSARPAPAADEVVREWPLESLPETPEVVTQIADTPDDSSRERVIIEDEVVSRLLQRKPGEAASKAKEPEPGQVVQEQTDAAALKQKPADHYTLQLMASRDSSALSQLVSRHRLAPAWVYSRSLNGEPWYVLVYGDYASPEKARAAITALPAELRAARPWPKPFGQVQKEVAP